ncbi:MAG: hypothetical protein SynsKO_28310 [Synoicihabitans sp.]
MAKKSPARTAKKSAQKTAAKKKAPTKKTTKKVATKKAPTKKAVAKKATPKKAAAKKIPASKKAAGKKPAAKKSASTKSVKKTTTKKSPAKKATAAKKAPAKKVAAKKAPPEKAAPPAEVKKASARAVLKSRALGKSKSLKASKSIAFSLDEVKKIARTTSAKERTAAKKEAIAAAAKAAEKKADLEATIAAAKPSKIAPASLADILGFNPTAGKKATYDDPAKVPAKHRKYYKLLLELRTHLTGQIDQHAEDTLKRSSKDDAGDLSSYGQHMADAGTDTFDRDFALSLVANEQEALSEIEAAIQRIKNGTYGMDEVTGKPIDKDRLAAVPFTRYTAETQKNLERNRHRVRTQAGLGGEMGDAAAAMAESNPDE